MLNLTDDEIFFLAEILDAELDNDKSFLEAPNGDKIAKRIIKKLKEAGYDKKDSVKRERIFG